MIVRNCQSTRVKNEKTNELVSYFIGKNIQYTVELEPLTFLKSFDTNTVKSIVNPKSMVKS